MGSVFGYDLPLNPNQSIHFSVDFDLTKSDQYSVRAENRPFLDGDNDTLAGGGGEYNGSFLVFYVKTPKGLMTINCSGAK